MRSRAGIGPTRLSRSVNSERGWRPSKHGLLVAALSSLAAAGFQVVAEGVVIRPEASDARRHATCFAPKEDVIEITFSDVNMNMMADMVFRDFLVTPRVKELEGRRVRVTGIMFSEGESLKTDNFYLLKNKECKFGRGGQADHLFMVKVKDNKKVKLRVDSLTVEGTFHLNPQAGPDGNTWSVFDLLDAVAK